MKGAILIGATLAAGTAAAQEFVCAFDQLCPAEGACEQVDIPEVLDITIDRGAGTFAIDDETFVEVTVTDQPPDSIAFSRQGDTRAAGIFRFVDIGGTVVMLIENDALGLGHAGMQGNCAVRKDP